MYRPDQLVFFENRTVQSALEDLLRRTSETSSELLPCVVWPNGGTTSSSRPGSIDTHECASTGSRFGDAVKGASEGAGIPLLGRACPCPSGPTRRTRARC